LVVYDAGQSESFHSLKHTYEHIQTSVVGLAKDDLSVIVVNNRIDVEESSQRNEIDEDTGRTWARDRGLDFLQTSCLRKETVDEAFHNIIVQVQSVKWNK
jgi:hypothetical protein